MRSWASLACSDLSESQVYNILVEAIGPRPIALVSTLDEAGIPNLAPFSFFMPGGVNPPSLAISVNEGAAGRKDTLRNILATKDFVVNTVHREMANGMNVASFTFRSEDSEWPATGFTAIESADVRPPRVGESLVQFECRLFEVVHHGSGPGAANYVIGEVVRAHVLADLWTGTAVEHGSIRLLSRMGGPTYLDTSALEFFEMPRPTAPPR